MMFAPLAPLVVVAAAVVMWLSSWVYKYQLMFVFTTKVETGGVRGLSTASLIDELTEIAIAHVECCHQSPASVGCAHESAHGSQYVTLTTL